jgi:hypothetical protein
LLSVSIETNGNRRADFALCLRGIRNESIQPKSITPTDELATKR